MCVCSRDISDPNQPLLSRVHTSINLCYPHNFSS